MSKYTIGIDLGGTTMTAGLVDENYKIIGKTTWATRLPRPAEDLESALAAFNELPQTYQANAVEPRPYFRRRLEETTR